MQVPTEITVNQNAAQCIKEVSYFGSTVYHNICNGTMTNVPWGGADWFGAIVLCSLGAALVIGAIFLVLLLVKEVLVGY